MARTISPKELSGLLKKSPPPNIIDVRTPVEFSEIHVPTAKNIPLDKLSPETLIELNSTFPHLPLYLLCKGTQRSFHASDQLACQGITNTIVVEGGTLAWIDAGLPVEKGTPQVFMLEKQMRIAAGAIVLTSALLARFVNPAFIWLGGGIGAGLIASGISQRHWLGPLIAKAPWNHKRK